MQSTAGGGDAGGLHLVIFGSEDLPRGEATVPRVDIDSKKSGRLARPNPDVRVGLHSPPLLKLRGVISRVVEAAWRQGAEWPLVALRTRKHLPTPPSVFKRTG